MQQNRLIVLVVVVAAVASGAVGFWLSGALDSPGGPPADTTPTETTPTQSGTTPEQTATPEPAGGGSQRSFSLLPLWQEHYDGSCASCHMAGEGTDDSSLHEAPYHPIGLSSGDTEKWFYDDGAHAGPNVEMAAEQMAGIKPLGNDVSCGDCHTVSNENGFANPENSGATKDPHAVHENVVAREGCDRCHGNDATAETSGVNSPIEMTRKFDEDFLSTDAETDEEGLTEYMSTESPTATEGSCGDCHGQYHKANLGFSFDPSTSVGPVANATGGEGVRVGETSVDCGSCHTNNVHAVHTNGNMSMQLAEGPSRKVGGAESCLQCHGVSIARDNGGHFTRSGARALGLIGDLDSEPNAAGYGVSGGDCGFCHSSEGNARGGS